MPLLRKEPFVKAPVPIGLKPDDEVFYVALTGEIFTNYDDFFKRTILLNSLVWSCSATGRSGLTYEEALNSERSAQDSLEVFPDNLERPLMFLVSLSCRGRIDDLVFDIWSFCKERYLVGEIVEVCYKGSKSFAQVLLVKYVGSDNYEDSSTTSASTSAAQTDLKQDDNDEQNEERDEVYASGRRKPRADYRAPPPSHFVYEVAILPKKNLDELISMGPDALALKSYPKAQLSPHEILRRRHLLTKQKCRLFVKTVCEPRNGFWVVRDSAACEYELHRMDWAKDAFGGPFPIFRRTPASRRSVLASSYAQDEDRPPSSSGRRQRTLDRPSPVAILSEEELKLKQLVEKQEMALASLIDDCNRYNVVGGGKQLSLDDFPLDSMDVELNEQILAELRERAKTAKDEEKERHRQMKRREKEAQLEWRKPRDDLQCDDHRPLPDLPPVRTPPFLPTEYFGDLLVLLEFLTSFDEELNLKEYFPTANEGGVRVSLPMIYEALNTSDIEPLDSNCNEAETKQRGSSVLMKLFKALLAQVFRRLAEEEGDEADLDNREDLQHENCDLDNPYYGKIVEHATRASEGVRNTHSISIRHLPIDSVTLAEVLRLHLNASGYYPGTNPGRFRYQSRGGYRCWDDPGMTFRLRNLDVMKRLNQCTIFELDAVDRLKLLNVLLNQLLTFSSMRFPLQQKTERLQALRYEIRQLQLNDQKHEREALTAKICKQEARAAAVLENGQLKDDQKYDPEKPSTFVQRLRKYLPKALPTNDKGEQKTEITWDNIEEENQSKIRAMIGEVDYEGAALEEIDDIREVQKQIFFRDERRLVEEIYRLQTACGMVILGRDRAYRRYNLLASLGAVLIERSDRTIGECVETCGTPLDRVEGIVASKNDPRRATAVKKSLLVCTGNVDTCPVHNHRWEKEEWYLINTREGLDQLAASLNRRGFRESELLENLEFFRPFIERAFTQCPTEFLLRPDNIKREHAADAEQTKNYCEGTLKETLLDFEERLSGGNFGGLKGRARDQWRQAIEKDELYVHGTVSISEDGIVSGVHGQPNSVEVQSRGDGSKVRAYANHLLDLVSAIHLKAYRKTFTEAHGRYVEGEFIETGTNSLDLWKNALSTASSYPQLHLYVATLDNAIAWNKSTTQMRCRLCRRKGDIETVVECDGCERLYHTACMKSQAIKLPDPSKQRWYCPDCAPRAVPQHQKADRLTTIKGDDDNADDLENGHEEEYCESCHGSLKGSKRRFTCSACAAAYHPSCAVASGSSKWTKAEISRWKCDTCAADDGDCTPGADSDNLSSAVRYRSSVVNDSDAGSDMGQNSSMDLSELSARLSAAAGTPVTSTRTGRVVKRPKSFDDIEVDPSKLTKRKSVGFSNNGSNSPSSPVKPSTPLVTALQKPPAISSNNADSWQPSALRLLQELSSHADAWPFLKPVTKKIAPDYFSIIKTPMDFSTVRTKVYRNAYKDVDELVSDLELVFQNCRTYNGPMAPVYQCGVRLEAFMKERICEILPSTPSKRTASRKHSATGNGTSEDAPMNGDSAHDTRKRRKR